MPQTTHTEFDIGDRVRVISSGERNSGGVREHLLEMPDGCYPEHRDFAYDIEGMQGTIIGRIGMNHIVNLDDGTSISIDWHGIESVLRGTSEVHAEQNLFKGKKISIWKHHELGGDAFGF
jgi:hypothetical protein